MPTKQEFIQTIRQKYPQYNEVQDDILFNRIIDKYPVYKSQITDIDSPVSITQLEEPFKEEVTQTIEKPGFFEKATDVFTGKSRTTTEMEQLPSVGKMPELNKMSMAGLRSALITMTGDDEEAAKALQANFPGVEIRTDDKGNLIVKSAIDGKEYAVNKPGLDTRDLIKAGLIAAMFSPTGKVVGTLGKMGLAAGIQTGLEAVQKQAGGEFDTTQIGLAGATEAIAPGFSRAAKGIKGISKVGVPSAAQTAVKEAEEAGVKVLTSDIIPPTTFSGKLAQASTERIPFVGTGPVRASQQVQRTEAVRNVLRDYGADQFAQVSDDVAEELLKKRGADLTKYSNLKNEVIDRLATKGSVNVDNTLSVIGQEITKLKSLKTKGVEGVINLFEDYKNAFQNQDLKNIELLRKQIGEQLKDPNLANIRSTAEKSVSKIYKAARDDMGNFIKDQGERRDFIKWGVANKQLSKMMDDLEVGTLKSTLKKGEATPEVVRRMIFSKKPSEIKLLYKNLPLEGRNKAKVAILQEVMEKAGGIDNITPEKFLTQMKKMEKSTQVFFNKEDKKVFNGLIKALNLTKRASESAVKPPTGVEATSFIAPLALGNYFGLIPGAATYGGIGGAARAYESKLVRNLLLQLSAAKPGREQIIVDRLVNVMQSKRQLNGDQEK